MSFLNDKLMPSLRAALSARERLQSVLLKEKTDAYRLFHGVAEGVPGLTVDRYGDLILAQTFREPLSLAEQESLRETLGGEFDFVCNHRGKNGGVPAEPSRPEALDEKRCREFGVEFLIKARHQGIDPWLFLDLRVGRRYLRESVRGLSVLNLFAYTCSVGVSAAVAGAAEVWNVDFAASNLDVGRRNAELNGIEASRFRNIQEDCLPIMRQLAGLPIPGRRNKVRPSLKVEARTFDVVVLDPPAWSKGAFGAVDVAGDYQSLFKSAVLIAKPGGGRILATNHVASVTVEDWTDALRRCAEKAGRPLRRLDILTPEADFPSFDGRHPLKIAVCEV